MTNEQHILRLIQSHKELEHFDYSKAVDWAIDLIRQGKDTDNVLMLASFSEPIDRFEIRPYVTNVLNELGLEELDYKSAVIAETHYHLNAILNDREIRTNLQSLYQLCVDNDYESGLMNFYLIYHGWDELEEIGVNYYFEGADLDNIEEVLKKEARKWIDKYVHGIEVESDEQERTEEKEKTLPTTTAISKRADSAKRNDKTFKKLWSRLTGK
ncbi:hypothetical protein [Persicobacter psychrovividus]|uniref:DUF1186 domain-containing protein n=1 Tax=Persicobacter psychrovividus TaxID=387638 RepID=A0ABN6LDX3_9BACT|nr:hypothetical protein PEPS_36710 [Persicobacter psychrovividus]BDD01448.1 hypothetical protein PEPS_37280 [Persicobacter psychrovividus]